MVLNGCWSSSWLQWYIIIIMVGCHQEIEEDSLGLGFWPLVNPNQLYWANQGWIRRWGFWWFWGSFYDYMVIIEARVSPLSHFSWRLGLNWSMHCLIHLSVEKSTVVNCTGSDGFGGGNELDTFHSCWNKCYMTSRSLRMKKIKSEQKLPKIESDL